MEDKNNLYYLEEDFFNKAYSVDEFQREQIFIEAENEANADGKLKEYNRLKKAYEKNLKMQKKEIYDEVNLPLYIENNKLNEAKYVDHFKSDYEAIGGIVYIDNNFYTQDGVIPLGELQQTISSSIKEYVKSRIAQNVKNIVELMKIEFYEPGFKFNENVIHFNNGDYNTSTGFFFDTKSICKKRLPVDYDKNAKEPTKFLNFLNELVEEDDIKTIQQFMGYSLIPTTKAQVMLSIIGSGGEGKSVLGDICMSLFGDSAIKGSVHDIEKEKFFNVNLVDKLLFIDDDVSFNAFKTTNKIKTIVTADTPTTVEPKGQPHFQAKIYSRILCFGNASLESLYDKSNGFFRRQIIIKTKPKTENRKNNPNLSRELQQELPGIANWCIQGLSELKNNKFKMYQSEQAIKNLQESKERNCNIISFLDDEDYIKFGKDFSEHTSTLYSEYVYWCQNNSVEPMKRNSFTTYLRDNQHKHNIEYTTNCYNKNNNRARGFNGIKTMKQRNIDK